MLLQRNKLVLHGLYLPVNRPPVLTDDRKVFLVVNGYPTTEADFFGMQNKEFCDSIATLVDPRKRQIFRVIFDKILVPFVNSFGVDWTADMLLEYCY
jgi:hypothetical protein